MPSGLLRSLIPLLAVGLPTLAYFMVKPALYVAVISAAGVAIYLYGLPAEPRREMAARAMLCVVLMPVIAWSLHLPWLLYAVMLFWVPLVAGKPDRIVPVYLFSLLLLPGLDSTAAIGSLKLFDFSVHDGLAAGAAVATFSNRRKARPGARRDLPALAVILLIAAALARGTSFPHLLRLILNVVIDLGLPYYLVSRNLHEAADFRRALLWLGCGGVVLASILAYEAMKAWPIYNELFGRYGLQPFMVKSRAGMLRAGGPFVEATSAAMVLGLCILALWACKGQFRTAHHHRLLFLIALVGLVAPQSRGAWVGVGFALVLGQLYLRRYWSLIRGGLLAAGGLSLLLAAAVSSPSLSESLGLSGGSSDTSDYRRQLFDRGMEEFWHSPIVGFSNSQLLVRLNDLRQGEGIIDYVNSYIWIMLISGGIGLAVFLWVFLYYLFGMYRYRNWLPKDQRDKEVAAFIFCSLAMIMEMLFFTSFGSRPAVFLFVLFACAAAFLKLSRKPARRPLVAEPPMALALASGD